MTSNIRIYDTLSRTLQPLSIEEGKPFGFYCCGPTVYGPAHIGNFRTFLVQDIFRRVLEIEGIPLAHVRNLTDVDDKTIRRSQEEGLALKDFTDHWTQKFHADCEALNMRPPHEEPSAVDHIPQQIALIEQLVETGHAYVAQDGSVYYKVSSFRDYGKLAHLDPENLQSQSTTSSGDLNAADEYDRESVADFALWKAKQPEDGTNAWESPWSEGRPGWHIECSAMARHYLGDTLDMHTGGIDLIFPHHENEIAQTEAITQKPFSKHWLHSAHLQVEGQKMSKSLGNLYTLSDLEEKYTPMAVRYLLTSGQYRQPLNFTLDGLGAAQSALKKLEKLARFLLSAAGLSDADWGDFVNNAHPDHWGSFKKAWNALCEDLNTPEALGGLFSAAKKIEKSDLNKEGALRELKALGALVYAFGLKLFEKKEIAIPESVQALAEKRWEAKKARDFARADQLRDNLVETGWRSLDTKDGYTLEPLDQQ